MNINQTSRNHQSPFSELGSKPSRSEESGLSLLKDDDLVIFSPGMSTAGFAEIRMVEGNTDRQVIATTIDEEGFEFANETIKKLGYADQIETRIEDLTSDWHYPQKFFDFIYARLVLHYLSAPELDSVLRKFYVSLKKGGRIFIVVRSDKNIDFSDPNVQFDKQTKITLQPHYNKNMEVEGFGKRYFHSASTITNHLKKNGFKVVKTDEYQEQLYKDFLRKEISPNVDHLIEILAEK